VLCVARTSTLKVGDGVVAINGVELEDKNSEDVDRLLAETDKRATTVLTVCRTVAAAPPTATAATNSTGNHTCVQGPE